MSEKEKTGVQKDKMLEFFKDEAVDLINTKLTPEDGLQESSIIPVDPRPILVKTPEVDQEENQKYWLDLRKFYQTSAGGMTPLDIEKQVVKPFYQTQELVLDETGAYPFWIDPDVPGQGVALSKTIETAISNSSEKTKTGILAKRLTGLLEEVTQTLASDDDLTGLDVLLDKSVHSYAERIGLTETDLEGYLTDWRQLKNSLPKSGFLVTKSQVDLFEILSTALQLDIQASQANFIGEVDDVIAHVTDMLAIQNENTGEANAPDNLKSSFGDSEDMLNFDKLSSMLPKGASELMPQVRIERLQRILEVLSGAADFLNSSNQIIWQELLLGWKDSDFKRIFGDSNTGSYPVKELVTRAKHEFERLMVSYKDIIASFRIGKLELADVYKEEIHDDFFAHFNWHQITADELRSFPNIIVMLDANQFDKHLMAEFSEILGNNLPVHIVCIRAINDHMLHDEHYQEQFFDNFELASLAISYRQAFVMQASDADPELLYKGFCDGLSSPSASLFYVLFGEENHQSWPDTAVRSRAFPNFTFSGKYGTDWGSRFNISHNPQVAKNWPEYTFEILDEEKQISELTSYLTYADYKLLNKSFSSEFKIVPRAYWTDDLVHLASFLSMDEKDQYAKIPYIWGLSAENELQKVAVSWEMMIKTAEKMDYWQFIQENGGVNSYHVREALSREKRRLQQEADKDIDDLKAAQQQEIEKVREETAAESMDRLTALLLDIDTQSIITTPTSKPAIPLKEEKVSDQVEAEEEVPQVEEDEVLSMDEPWIETPLCTSCNECIELNGSLFKYNADKMAVIGDLKAGTFSQLVQAAEKCPVHIIHPGKPMDASEPDLEDLIKRAEKFN